jgi:urease accessory protein
MPRGSVLRGGDTLALSDGRVVLVSAAPELVSTVRAESARALARVAYHLGNRHIPLEVGEGFVRYQHDHVLDGMVRELGLMVVVEDAPFEPEGGAYGRHGHSHSHSRSHSHGNEHVHEDGDEHAHAHDSDRAVAEGRSASRGVVRAVEMVRLDDGAIPGEAGERAR